MSTTDDAIPPSPPGSGNLGPLSQFPVGGGTPGTIHTFPVGIRGTTALSGMQLTVDVGELLFFEGDDDLFFLRIVCRKNEEGELELGATLDRRTVPGCESC